MKTTMRWGSFALLVVTVVAIALAVADGTQAFLDNRCQVCHSVEAGGIERKPTHRASDLSAVGSAYDAEFLVAYLKKEKDIDGKKHPPAFRGSDADLQALAEWLASLKNE